MQKKKILMQFLIFFCYELIVCPLIFKSNKVYFASSLIAKPIQEQLFFSWPGLNCHVRVVSYIFFHELLQI